MEAREEWAARLLRRASLRLWCLYRDKRNDAARYGRWTPHAEDPSSPRPLALFSRSPSKSRMSPFLLPYLTTPITIRTA
jgi:hypothetical protein